MFSVVGASEEAADASRVISSRQTLLLPFRDLKTSDWLSGE